MFTEEEVKKLIAEEGFRFIRRFTSGNSGAVVQLLEKNNDLVVIKIPTDARSLDEVLSNILGYGELIRGGQRELLPNFLKITYSDNGPYIMMSYLGDDFETKTKAVESPERLYDELCHALHFIYHKTNTSSPTSARSYLLHLQEKLVTTLKKNLMPAGLCSEEDVHKSRALSFSRKQYSQTCFCPYDFTPEDVFLVNGRIIYPDPKKECHGLPQISLACFSGVARDAYCLPGSMYGYKRIHDFAVGECSTIMGISKSEAEMLFLFGLALQSSISSKYRIQSEPDRAEEFARHARECLSSL